MKHIHEMLKTDTQTSRNQEYVFAYDCICHRGLSNYKDFNRKACSQGESCSRSDKVETM